MDSRFCFHPVRIDDETVWPCGKCPVCRMKYRKQMAVRIYMEKCIERPVHSYFVTLTYDDEHIPTVLGRSCFKKEDLVTFLDSLRHRLRRDGFLLRYFGTCEYGEEGYRPHYHFLFYLYPEGWDPQGIYPSSPARRYPKYITQDGKLRPYFGVKVLESLWNKGFVYTGYTSLEATLYCTAYALKDDEALERDWIGYEEGKPFRLFSLRPGLGLTQKCTDWWSERIYNDGVDIRNSYHKDLKYRKLSTGIPVGVKRRISDNYPELYEKLKAANKESFDESRDSLQANGWKYGFDKWYGADYVESKGNVSRYTLDPDNHTVAFRKALRELGKKDRNPLK